MKNQWFFRFRRSKLGAKIDQKSKLFVEFLPKRFQDAPRRPQDVPKMLQDTPRRPRDGPRPPRGRARTAPRRPQTPQDGSKLVPRGARKRPRRRQIRGKKRHKSDPKRNPFQISFWQRLVWVGRPLLVVLVLMRMLSRSSRVLIF